MGRNTLEAVSFKVTFDSEYAHITSSYMAQDVTAMLECYVTRCIMILRSNDTL